MLLACIVLQSVVILGFAFSKGNFEIMALSRFLTGVFQVFISIFAPCWCDCHAPDNSKTTWITSIMVSTPAGMVTGYLLTAVIISSGGQWQISFFLQVLLLIPIAVYIASIDKKFLDLKSFSAKEVDSDEAPETQSSTN